MSAGKGYVRLKELPEPGVTIKSGVIIDADTGDQVLSLMPNYKYMSQLIAAAPELLEALKGLVSYGNVFLHRQFEKSPYDEAIKALSKAEGRNA